MTEVDVGTSARAGGGGGGTAGRLVVLRRAVEVPVDVLVVIGLLVVAVPVSVAAWLATMATGRAPTPITHVVRWATSRFHAALTGVLVPPGSSVEGRRPATRAAEVPDGDDGLLDRRRVAVRWLTGLPALAAAVVVTAGALPVAVVTWLWRFGTAALPGALVDALQSVVQFDAAVVGWLVLARAEGPHGLVPAGPTSSTGSASGPATPPLPDVVTFAGPDWVWAYSADRRVCGIWPRQRPADQHPERPPVAATPAGGSGSMPASGSVGWRAKLPDGGAARADVARSDTAGPEMAGPEMAGPEMAGPEMAGTDVAGTEVTGTHAARSTVSQPEGVPAGGARWWPIERQADAWAAFRRLEPRAIEVRPTPPSALGVAVAQAGAASGDLAATAGAGGGVVPMPRAWTHRLVVLMVVVGLVGLGSFGALALTSGTSSSTSTPPAAATMLSDAYGRLHHAVAVYAAGSRSCLVAPSAGADTLACVTAADRAVAAAFARFEGTLRVVSLPRAAAAARRRLLAVTAACQAGFDRLAGASSEAAYDLLLTVVGVRGLLTRFDTAYGALVRIEAGSR
jgi:hypothetical protein